MKAAATRLAFARLHQRMSTVGVVGLGLAALALVNAGLAWREQRHFEAETPARTAPVTVTTPRAKQASHLPLRPLSDVPLLLTHMERAALEQGLGWPHADYRINAASDDTPASLEVHCVLKGPYPGVRSFVTRLLQDTPTLTLREFSLSRASAEASDVEAKLGIVVYLASGSTTPSASSGVAP